MKRTSLPLQRREFITLLGGAAAAWPLAARAQQPAKPATSGSWAPSTRCALRAQWIAAFVQRLRELGWIEGRNVTIEYRWAEGRNERFAEIAAEFVRLKVDVIVTAGTGTGARRKEGNIGHPDRIRGGERPGWRRLVASLRGQAATSPACRSQATDLGRKRLELLREVVAQPPPAGDPGQCRAMPPPC